MNTRDYDYIENRLTAPELGALEARGRLTQCGDTQLADRIMKAAQEYTDAMREIHNEFRHRHGRGYQETWEIRNP